MAGLKVALTVSVPFTVIVQVVELPVHAPPHPPKLAKVDGDPGDSVSTTWVPLSKFAEQVPGQVMPAGALEMVPVAGLVAVTVTVSVMGPV
ncbi:MAG: hypothetical protein WA609_16055 [Terriglobales bacterium]